MKSKRKTTLYNKVETKTRTPHEHEYAYAYDAHCNQAFPSPRRTTDPTRRTKGAPCEPTHPMRMTQTHFADERNTFARKSAHPGEGGRGGNENASREGGRRTGISHAHMLWNKWNMFHNICVMEHVVLWNIWCV